MHTVLLIELPVTEAAHAAGLQVDHVEEADESACSIGRDRGMPPAIVQTTPVPTQAMHFNRPRQSVPSLIVISLVVRRSFTRRLTGAARRLFPGPEGRRGAEIVHGEIAIEVRGRRLAHSVEVVDVVPRLGAGSVRGLP